MDLLLPREGVDGRRRIRSPGARLRRLYSPLPLPHAGAAEHRNCPLPRATPKDRRRQICPPKARRS